MLRYTFISLLLLYRPLWQFSDYYAICIIHLNVVIIIRLVHYFLYCTVCDRPAADHQIAQCSFSVTWIRKRCAYRHYPVIDSTCSPLTVNLTSHSALNKLYSSQTSFYLSKYSWHETFPMWPVTKSFWRHLFFTLIDFDVVLTVHRN